MSEIDPVTIPDFGPDPTEEDLRDPVFQAVWEAIKQWDIKRHPGRGYAGATGSDVMVILRAVRGTPDPTQVDMAAILENVRKLLWALEEVADGYHGEYSRTQGVNRADIVRWALGADDDDANARDAMDAYQRLTRIVTEQHDA